MRSPAPALLSSRAIPLPFAAGAPLRAGPCAPYILLPGALSLNGPPASLDPEIRMNRRATYVCSECGATHAKWSGRCDACGAWNTIEEDAGLSATGPQGRTLGASRGRRVPLTDLSLKDTELPRRPSGLGELDRVLGGGIVPASAILVGGDPGIGKSTFLL
jgi:Rubredoxin metal binding domain